MNVFFGCELFQSCCIFYSDDKWKYLILLFYFLSQCRLISFQEMAIDNQRLLKHPCSNRTQMNTGAIRNLYENKSVPNLKII